MTKMTNLTISVFKIKLLEYGIKMFFLYLPTEIAIVDGPKSSTWMV